MRRSPPPAASLALTDFDDTYLCGVPAEVATALVAFEAAIALVGAELQRPKSAALLGATCVLPADFPVPVGVIKHGGPGPQHGQVIGHGIKVAGIPLGDAAFVAETLRRKGDKLQAKFETVTSKLEHTISPFNNSKFQLSLRFLGV